MILAAAAIIAVGNRHVSNWNGFWNGHGHDIRRSVSRCLWFWRGFCLNGVVCVSLAWVLLAVLNVLAVQKFIPIGIMYARCIFEAPFGFFVQVWEKAVGNRVTPDVCQIYA